MNRIDTLLLLALPASGKSEIRRYLAEVDPSIAAAEFHLGPTVQLDDYPYVQLMQLINAEIQDKGGPPTFFETPNGLLNEPRDWGMLARLLAEDYSALGTSAGVPGHPTAHLLARFDRARLAVGAAPVTTDIPETLLRQVATVLDDEIADFSRGLSLELGTYDTSSTVVVEFARGGPDGATFPLPRPHGYRYTLSHLGPAMLGRASVLYIWVTAAESRRRNVERSGPGPIEEASVLHHRVPEVVMRENYGTDDFLWLISSDGGHIEIESEGHAYRLPAQVLDNRSDHTSFLRSDIETWPATSIETVHGLLRASLGGLVGATRLGSN